jgi:hypothetical protein
MNLCESCTFEFAFILLEYIKSVYNCYYLFVNGLKSGWMDFGGWRLTSPARGPRFGTNVLPEEESSLGLKGDWKDENKSLE